MSFTANVLAEETTDLYYTDRADNDKPKSDLYIFVGIATNIAVRSMQTTLVEKRGMEIDDDLGP